MKLIFVSRILELDKTLGDYGVTEGSLIVVHF